MSSFYETIKEAKLILKIYTSYVFLYTKILAERPENAEFKKNEKWLKRAFGPLWYSALWDEKPWTMKFCHISYFRTLNCTRVFSWVLLLWTSPTTLGINGTPFVLAMNRLKIGQSCIKSVFLCSKVKLKLVLYKTKVSRKNKIIAFQKKWIALAISREKQSILVHGPVWTSKMK